MPTGCASCFLTTLYAKIHFFARRNSVTVPVRGGPSLVGKRFFIIYVIFFASLAVNPFLTAKGAKSNFMPEYRLNVTTRAQLPRPQELPTHEECPSQSYPQ